MNAVAVGQIEKATQARVVALFHQRLGYSYLGNWIDQDNANIDLTPPKTPPKTLFKPLSAQNLLT